MLEKVNPSTVGMCEDRLERVTQWLEEQVSSERLAGASVMISRQGKISYLQATGFADKEVAKPFNEDSVVRIYSMSKPITSVAAMMLYEQGYFQLDDPIAKYIPEFANTPVWQGGDASVSQTVAQASPILVKHLMSHTSGLTYGFMQSNVVDAEYRKEKIEFINFDDSLAEIVTRLAKIPLISQPGSQWNYSVSTDVLGRLVEIWSGMRLADFFQQRIFIPLQMHDTAFQVKAENRDRFSALYAPANGVDMSSVGKAALNDKKENRLGLTLQEGSSKSRYFNAPKSDSGGGGLVGSIGDYGRFCQMLLNGGVLDGSRLLSPTTVRFMSANQLPNDCDMAAMGQPVWSETSYDGIGFGLGFAVVLDPPKASIITSKGEYHWGGAASTFFWIDPVEDLFVVFFTQLIPSSTYPIRRELRARVYQALVE
jgi:CubicO group peptidase (beta-lactamase class C family)